MKRRNPELGEKVNGHCPYDETTLRADLARGGYTCPCCWSHFTSIAPDPEHSADHPATRSVFVRNIFLAPVVVLFRAPIMLLGMALTRIGEVLWDLGDRMPGWERGA